MKKSFLQKLLSLFSVFAILFNTFYLSLFVLATDVLAAPPSASLDQCANGDDASPTDPCTWQNGNLNSNQAHYVEGQSVPYRAVMTDLPTATPITLTVGYDIKHSGAHALDYLTHFDRLEPHSPFGHTAETINPTSGVSGVSGTTTTFAIPAPSSSGSPIAGQPTDSFNSLPAQEREMTLFGGTITGISYNTQGVLTDAQSETTISISFTVDSATAVLSWGGHIGSRLDWGEGNSAGGISGSPYHMRLTSWNLNNLGNQDRSLQAGAVFSPVGDITIVKNTIPDTDDSTEFAFTGDAGEFVLIGNGASQTLFNLDTGVYSVSETGVDGWSLTDISCEGDLDSGSIIDLENGTVDIDLDDGEAITCTFTNTKLPTLTVNKIVNPANDQGLFNLLIDGEVEAPNVGDGGTTGAQIVDVGAHSVSETAGEGTSLSDYQSVIGGACDSSGNITLAAGENAVCTITNTRYGSITVEKQTTPDQTSGTFTFTGDVSGEIGDNGTLVLDNVLPGTYTSTETDPGIAWDLDSIVCSDTDSTGDLQSSTATFNVDAGENVTCTFTNVKLPTLEVVKELVPANDPGLFDLLIEGFPYATDVGDGGTTGPQILEIGDYDVSEEAGTNTLLSDYNTTFSENCANGEITLEAGDEEVCTITNTRKTGLIEFLKIVEGGDADPLTWFFSVLGVDGSFQSGDSAVLNTGTYSISESDIPGYTLTDTDGSVCFDHDGISATLFVTEEGGVCSFTNTRDTGSVTVNKLVDTDADGTFESGNSTANTLGFDWGLDLELPERNMGTTLNDVETDDHTVTEDEVSDYHVVGWFIGEGSCSELDGEGLTANITVEKDETTTVTFCNARDAGTLTVNKQVDSDGNGVYEGGNTEANILGFSWGLGENDTPNAMGSSIPFLTGSFEVWESEVPGYHFTGWYPTNDEQYSCESPYSLDYPVDGSVSADEETEITLCNARDLGTITVLKDIDWDESGQVGDHPDDIQGTTSWTWDIAGGEQDIATGDSRTLVTGTYTLSEDLQDNYHLVGWSCDNDTSGSTNSIEVNLGSENDVTCTITNSPDRGSILGSKWNDLNGDGVWDEGEPGLEDWEIEIYTQYENLELGNEQSTETDENGDYSFENLVPGNYVVCEVLQEGWIQTYPEEGEEAGVVEEYGVCHYVEVGPDQDVEDVNFGNFRLGRIQGFKYEDTNGNGVWDEGEEGLNGWEICIESESLEEGYCTETYDDESYGDGYFEFLDLLYGTYFIEETEEDGYEKTEPEEDGYEIDIISGTGWDEENEFYLFGNAPLGSIHGYKWNDENGDGGRVCLFGIDFICDFLGGWDEELLGGWTIELYFDSGEGFELIDSMETETDTESDHFGWYWFEDLFPGDYMVCEVLQNGWEQTYPNESDCHLVTLPDENPNDFPELINAILEPTPTYNFGNQEVILDLDIEKSNDKSGGASAGETVNYTLAVTNNGNQTVTNLEVIDVLPGGFTYVSGSTKINGVADSDPTQSGGQLIWSVGSLDSEETVTIEYQATIPSDAVEGTYTNLATCEASYFNRQEDETELECEVVSSDVVIGGVLSLSTSIGGQVLGITLPAAGSDTNLLIGFALMVLAGLGLKVKAKKMESGKN